jgi:hypothetical protein
MRNGGFPVLRKICYTLGAAAAAGAMAVSGFAAAGAATTACGKVCLDIGFVDPGGSALLASNSLAGAKGTLVRLEQGSDGLPTEDFVEIKLGTVVPTYCTATGQAQTGSVFTADQCELLVADGYTTSSLTYEIAFSPNNGGPEDECIGATSPKPGSAVRLEPCGASAGTVLIAMQKLPGGRMSPTDSVWLVNGASDNFSNPNVLTSDGTYPSDPTWAPVVYNGKRGIDTQEVCGADGPYDGAIPTCSRSVRKPPPPS